MNDDDEEEGEVKTDAPASSSSSSAAAAASSSSSSSSAAAAAAAGGAGGEVTDDMLEEAYQNKQQRHQLPASSSAAASAARPGKAAAAGGASDDDEEEEDDDDDNRSSASGASSRGIVLPSNAMNSSLVTSSGAGEDGAGVPRLLSNGLPADWFLNRARFIPLRLTLEERKFLRLLEATLNVSEYTDKVDIVSNKDKMLRIKEQLRDLCSILSGLVVANDYKLGQKLIKDREFADNADFFGNVFELGRRHKIRNPEKMRNVYGKLVYIVQDSVNPAIEELMGFNLHAPLKTVYRQLEAAGALNCLTDERMMQATSEHRKQHKRAVHRHLLTCCCVASMCLLAVVVATSRPRDAAARRSSATSRRRRMQSRISLAAT
jgi:hypothetical protein